MATDVEYKSYISKLSYSEVIGLWEMVKADSYDKSFWNNGRILEYLILRAFELEKCSVTYPYTVKEAGVVIEQIDGCIFTPSLSILIECKLYKSNSPLSVEPISKLRNQLVRRPSSVVGALFSTSGFTEPALIISKFLAPQTILLWPMRDIDFCFKNQCFTRGMNALYKNSVENGKNYGIVEYLI